GDPAANGDPVWKQLGRQLPNAPVFDLEVGVNERNEALLVAGTLGRGAFTLALPAVLSAPGLASLFAANLNAITGVTIVTHGWEPFGAGGDALLPLARALRSEIDAANGADRAWLLDYDSATGLFDPIDSVIPGAADATASGEV